MLDPLITHLHDFLWVLIDALVSLFAIAPYIAVFTILSLVFTGLALAIRQQHEELEQKDEGEGKAESQD